MKTIRRGRALVLLALGGASTMLAAASCSLGLDESKIGAGQEAGTVDTNVADTAAGDAGDAGPTPGLPDAATCTKVEDCTTTHGCLKGRCDLSRKACVFDVCHATACNAAACDTNAKTCGAPKAYPFKATQFQVGAQVSRIAAVHPGLFAQTATGIVAFNVGNVSATAPPAVPVVGLGFVPTQMVVSGSRLFFLDTPTGPGPSRLPVAWIDVPSDPFAGKIEATSVLATYSRPAAEGVGLVARGGDTALLLGPQGQSFPSSTVEPPLVEPLTITATPIVFTAGTSPVAMSGARLVMQAVDGQGIATFGLINGAGTATPQNAGDTRLADAGPLSGPQQFSQSPEGAVFWTIASLSGAPGATGTVTRALRGHFLVPEGTAAVDPAGGFDVEVYNATPVGQGANLAGPTAMLDANTAIVLAAARENPGAATAVQFARRQPLGIVKNADNTTPRRTVLPVPLGNFVGAAGSNGIGYAAANEGGPMPNATVYVFDPACAP
jgi:hypothetical protein